MALEYEAVVYLVGQQQHVVFAAQFDQPRHLLARPDAAHRVVRVAHNDHARAAAERVFQILVIEREVAVLLFERAYAQHASGVARGVEKRRVYGRGYHYLVAGARQRVYRNAYRADHVGIPHYPFALYMHAEPVAQPADNCVIVLVDFAGVADMPCSARALSASTISGAVATSMSATHIGITSSLPNMDLQASSFSAEVPRRSIILSNWLIA